MGHKTTHGQNQTLQAPKAAEGWASGHSGDAVRGQEGTQAAPHRPGDSSWRPSPRSYARTRGGCHMGERDSVHEMVTLHCPGVLETQCSC